MSYTRGGLGEKVERLNREVRAMAVPGGSEEIMIDLGVRQTKKMAEMAKQLVVHDAAGEEASQKRDAAAASAGGADSAGCAGPAPAAGGSDRDVQLE